MIDLKKGEFITGRKKAAMELELKESTVWSYLKELQTMKTIDIKSNSKFSVVTVVNWNLYQEKIANNNNKTDSKKTADGQQMDTNKNDKNDNNIDSSKDADEVWSIYPNKKGKAQAIKNILKILKKYSKEELIECIERYAKESKGKDKQFMLYGSTFFNNRYEDYLDCNYEDKENKRDADRNKPEREISSFDY